MDWTNLKVLPVGQGHIDFDKFFGFIRETDYRGDFTLEATGFDKTGTVNFELLNGQFTKVRKLLENR